MSAFIVSKEHIDLLVAAGLRNPANRVRWYDEPIDRSWSLETLGEHRRELTYDTADAVGAMLLAENVASVRYRYAASDPDDMVPDWILEEGYSWQDPHVTPEPVEILKAIDCYEYQACEHDDWPESEAQQFCEALRAHMIHALPGYNAAPWEWDDEEIAKRPRVVSLYGMMNGR